MEFSHPPDAGQEFPRGRDPEWIFPIGPVSGRTFPTPANIINNGRPPTTVFIETPPGFQILTAPGVLPTAPGNPSWNFSYDVSRAIGARKEHIIWRRDLGGLQGGPGRPSPPPECQGDPVDLLRRDLQGLGAPEEPGGQPGGPGGIPGGSTVGSGGPGGGEMDPLDPLDLLGTVREVLGPLQVNLHILFICTYCTY